MPNFIDGDCNDAGGDPAVLLESYSSDTHRYSHGFSGRCGQIVALKLREVVPALTALERAVAEDGLHAAGFVAYEAASALDPALRTAAPTSPLPLLWFGLYRQRQTVRPGQLEPGSGYALSSWEPSLDRQTYETAVERIREYAASGDTYQVNLTMPLRAAFSGDDRALYRDLCLGQRASFCAYMRVGDLSILSASPELFFSLKNGRLTTRPMKGTSARGRWLEEDVRLASALRESSKDRAENLMIVDLLRNDLGRVSQAGSVRVPALWELERYDTLWQMTSTVESLIRPDVELCDLLTALFPSGSVTGAPKVRTMEIISELEAHPRGVYTGCIGFLSPGSRSEGAGGGGLRRVEAGFSVAIRTVILDRAEGRAEYGIGGGITHYSTPADEYEECLLKARVVTHRRPDFDLLETLLFEAEGGYYLLDRHLDRLCESARYFGYPCRRGEVAEALARYARELDGARFKVRLTVSRAGRISVSGRPMDSNQKDAWQAVVAEVPVDSGDPFLYHKTTNRRTYDERLARHPGYDEVVLYNQRAEVTECCRGNLVIVLEGERWTPCRDSGLLAGTYRAELLASGELQERAIGLDELNRAESVFAINSVRRWVRLELADSQTIQGRERHVQDR